LLFSISVLLSSLRVNLPVELAFGYQFDTWTSASDFVRTIHCASYIKIWARYL